MWEGIKAIAGLAIILGFILAVITTFIVFSWAIKVILVVIVILVVLAFFGYTVWDLVSGWWNDRKKKSP